MSGDAAMTPTPPLSVEIDVLPAFCDIDAMEIVYHGHYVRYLEIARAALLAKYDYDYPRMRESGFSWPIVDMRLKYVRPVVYGQALKVRATIVEWEFRLRIEYEIRDAQNGEKLNSASTIQVAVNMRTREMCYVCPPILWQKLGVDP